VCLPLLQKHLETVRQADSGPAAVAEAADNAMGSHATCNAVLGVLADPEVVARVGLDLGTFCPRRAPDVAAEGENFFRLAGPADQPSPANPSVPDPFVHALKAWARILGPGGEGLFAGARSRL